MKPLPEHLGYGTEEPVGASMLKMRAGAVAEGRGLGFTFIGTESASSAWTTMDFVERRVW